MCGPRLYGGARLRAAAGPGIVVALEGAALAAARYGYRLDVADGVPEVALDGAKGRLWEAAKARREAAAVTPRWGASIPIRKASCGLPGR